MTAGPDELLTVEEVLTELRVPRSTFYRWRQNGTEPPVVELPRGAVRIRRTAMAAWLRGLEVDPRSPPRDQLSGESSDIKKIGDTAKGRWRVRWAITGRETEVIPCQTAGRRVPDHPQERRPRRHAFETATGLPAPHRTARGDDVTWYEHACLQPDEMA